MQSNRIERLAEYLCSEFDFNLDPCVGYSWPEHEKDDGYRGDGSYVKLQPSDVQAYARENAKRILEFIEREAALSALVPDDEDTKAAIDLGAAVLSKIVDPAAREIAIRNALIAALNRAAQVQDAPERKPLDLNITKEWFERRSALEGDHEVGAGRRKLTASIDPTPEELAGLYRIAHRIPDGWQLVPIEPSAGMIAAAKSTTSAALTRSHATEIYRAMLAAALAKQEG